jgi:anaerobic sulfite reductase subunit C
MNWLEEALQKIKKMTGEKRTIKVSSSLRPVRTENPCIVCLQCVETCRQNSVFVNMRRVSFDYSMCLECGECSRVCPTQAIMTESAAYQILADEKLGRQPQGSAEFV